ncbi:MAG: SDR family oxidoreductase [Candidatus Binataceae bacterium]|jgi:NAD(P)-dependent dehydrogenase (short-subunit alcohol dehydrogenase family)
MKLQGKVALVTGAGRRVGYAIAIALAESGATLAIHYRTSKAGAEELAGQIAKAGGKAAIFAADLEKVAEIEQMIAAVIAAFGRIDILVNSASVFYRKPLEELTERDWDVNLDTNLKAPFFLSKFAGASMRQNGAGKIVNIGDWAGVRPYNNYLPYTVSKTGLIGLTRALAKALAPEVQVNCVALGPVMPPDDYDSAEIDSLRKATLTKTLGSPEDVARAVLFFCASTDFATGATLMLDGGRLLN